MYLIQKIFGSSKDGYKRGDIVYSTEKRFGWKVVGRIEKDWRMK